MRTSDHVAASRRRRSACLRTASVSLGVVTRPTPSRTRVKESSDRTRRTAEPARASKERTNARPPLRSAVRTRLLADLMMVSPLAGPHVGSRSALSLSRAPGAPSAVPPPDGGVPGTTPVTLPVAPRRQEAPGQDPGPPGAHGARSGRVLVTHAPHGLDRPAVLGAQLAAQPGHMDVDGAPVAHVSVPPDRR